MKTGKKIKCYLFYIYKYSMAHAITHLFYFILIFHHEKQQRQRLCINKIPIPFEATCLLIDACIMHA